MLFRETAVTLPGGVAGVLTIPVLASAERPAPGVLLFGGSGPTDPDFSLGPNRMGRDIAQGLATRGAAVLRIGRREAPGPDIINQPVPPGAEELFLADAREGLRLLAAHEAVTSTTLTVVGHDLGGYVAPEVAREFPGARLALLAPFRAPIAFHLRRQLEAMREGLDAGDDEARAAIDDLVSAAARLAVGGLEPTEVVLGLPGSVWNDLQRMRPDAEIDARDRQVLVLLGGRDAIIPAEDEAYWREVAEQAGRRSGVRVHAGLGHQFIAFDADDADEMDVRGNVAEAVVDDLARLALQGLAGR
jgi:dienelactone hydrolase